MEDRGKNRVLKQLRMTPHRDIHVPCLHGADLPRSPDDHHPSSWVSGEYVNSSMRASTRAFDRGDMPQLYHSCWSTANQGGRFAITGCEWSSLTTLGTPACGQVIAIASLWAIKL